MFFIWFYFEIFLIVQYKRNLKKRQSLAHQKYEQHKIICENLTKIPNFHSLWNIIKYNESNFTADLQLTSNGLKEFYWNMVKTSTKYSEQSIKKLLKLINNIHLPTTAINSDNDGSEDVEMKCEEEKDDEKQESMDESVCVSNYILHIFCVSFNQKSSIEESIIPDPATDILPTGSILCYKWDVRRGREDKATCMEMFMVYNHPDLPSDQGYYGYPLHQHDFMYNTSTDKTYRRNLHGCFFIHPKDGQRNGLPFGHRDSLHFVHFNDYNTNDGLLCAPFIPQVLNLYKVQVLYPFLLKKAKVEFFGSKSSTTFRIFQHSSAADALKQYPDLENNQHDYICLAIPDRIKQILNDNDICKHSLSNTTTIVNYAIKQNEIQQRTLNSIDFNSITINSSKKDSKKDRRSSTTSSQPKKKKQKKNKR